MQPKSCGFAGWVLALVAWSIPAVGADPPDPKVAADDAAQSLEFSVQVVDEQGEPVSKAKVKPWALRSSQGHGLWTADTPKRLMPPKEGVTDETGRLTVAYPRYYSPEERVRTTAVSLRVDHPEFAVIDAMTVQVPYDHDEPFSITLTRGVPVEVRPLIEGEKVDLDQIFALWSDGRTWDPGYAPEKTPDGTLKFAAMQPGENSLLLVRLDGDRATHFSRIVDFPTEAGQTRKFNVHLKPAVRISGTLSENVPRPIRRGRISVDTLGPSEVNRISWRSWAAVAPDGAFVIDSWPAGEPIQMIGLCDGYIAASGTAPKVVKNPPDPDEDLDDGLFRYPQVFEPDPKRSIVLSMLPMGRCTAVASDRKGKPVADVKVTSWPNVMWWNSGSQLYGSPLFSSRRALRTRDLWKSVETSLPEPFQGKTDAQGRVTFDLPTGEQSLYAESETHELPIVGGERHVNVTIEANKTVEAALPLQPLGTEQLGEK